MIILYRKSDGSISGVHAQPAVFVAAWLNDPANADIAAETGYLELDDALTEIATKLIAKRGDFRVDAKSGTLEEIGQGTVQTVSATRDALEKIDASKLATLADVKAALTLVVAAAKRPAMVLALDSQVESVN